LPAVNFQLSVVVKLFLAVQLLCGQLFTLSCSYSQSCAPPTPRRRRRRRRRPNVGAGAVFLKCSRHVVLQLYVVRFVYCHLQLSLNIDKKQRTMREYFATALDTQIKHRGVRAKVFSWTIL